MKRTRNLFQFVAASVFAGSFLVFADNSIAQGPPPGVKAVTKGPPNGAEIAAKARSIRLDVSRAAETMVGGKRVKFTPAAQSKTEDADGQVIGQMENDAPGDETGLAPGKYDVYFRAVNNEYEAFAESNGAIARKAARVSAQRGDGTTPVKTVVNPSGYCTGAGWYWVPSQWSYYDYNGYRYYYPSAYGYWIYVTVCW